jgi:N6-L-threonylcarbamoyladenine synthase
MTTVLGIETSCDETAVAVVVDGKKILSNILFSQIDLHNQYGGVYPELACRKHLQKILEMVDLALEKASVTSKEIDLIAVSGEPGLIGALLIGVTTAKTLAYAWKKPFVSVNHVEAHLYAAMMELDEIPLPSIGLVVSGGHTLLLKILSLGEYEEIGRTVDDAIGEAFDKVGRMLGLPYPGGPEVEKLARLGDETKYPLTQGKVKTHPLHFSFSGIKTQVLYTIKGQNGKGEPIPLSSQEKSDLAASFQKTVVDNLITTTLKAADQMNISSIFVGGGVSNNQYLRSAFSKKLPSNMKIYWPSKGLSLDNAAMIAGLGYHVYKKKKASTPLSFSPKPVSDFMRKNPDTP